MSDRWVPAPGFEDEFQNDSRPTAASEAFREGYAPSTEEDTKTRWGDYGRALGTGTLGVASAIPTLAEYATQGEVGGDTRRYLEGKREELTQGMTPVGKRSMNAAILPTEGQESIADVGIGSSIGLQGAAALPSVIASIIPGGLAARMARGVSAARQAAIAGGVARGSAAVMNSGDVLQQIFSTTDEMSDKELYDASPAFKGYIDAGLSPKEARGRFNSDVAGVTPFLAGGISALLATPEAEMAANIAGVGVKKGLLKGALHGAIGEAKEEAIESGTGEFMSEQKLAEQGLADRDWYNVLSKTVQGATIGAAVGGGTGGVTNMGGKPENQKIDVDQQTALQGQTGSQPAAQTVPEQPQTLDMQREALLNGQRPAMLYPKGTPELELPEGTDRLETPVGVIHYNPDLVDLDTVKQLATPDRINELEGYLQSKDQAAQQSAAQGAEPVAAVTRKNGVEVDAAVVSPDKAQEQLDILAQRAPAGSTQSVERPGDVVNGRMSAQVPEDIAAAMQPSKPAAPNGVGPAGQAILDQRQAPVASPEAADNIPISWDEEQDARDALAEFEAKWAGTEKEFQDAFDEIRSRNEPDLIKYDDGTIEEVKPIPLRGNKQPASGRSKGWMTPATEEAIRRAEANRAARNQPTPSEEPEGRIYKTMDAVYNPKSKRVTVGGWQFDLGAKDAIAIKKPDGETINFYDRDQRKHYGRRDEAYLDEMSAKGIPGVVHDAIRAYLKDKLTPEQFTERLNSPARKPASSSVQTDELTPDEAEAIRKAAQDAIDELEAKNATDELTPDEAEAVRKAAQEAIDEIEAKGAIKPKRTRRPAKQPAAQPDNGRVANSIPQLNDDSAKSRLKAATARIRNALSGRGRLKVSEVELPIADIVSQQDWIEPSRKEPALATNEPPVVVHVGGKFVLRDGNHRVSAMIDRGDTTAKVRLVELDPYGNSETTTAEPAKKAARSKTPGKTKGTKSVATTKAAEPTTEDNTPVNPPAHKSLGRITEYTRARAAKQAAQFNETRKKVQETDTVAESSSGDAHADRKGNKGNEEVKADRARDAAHKNAFLKNPPTKEELYSPEDIFEARRHKKSDNDVFVRTPKQAEAVIARLRKMLKAAGALPGTIHDTHTGYTHILAAARYAVESHGKTKDSTYMAINNFIAAEKLARENDDFSDARKLRKEARVREQQLAEGTDKADEASVDHGELGNRLGRTPTGLEKARYEYFMDRVLEAVEGRNTSEVKNPNSLDELQEFATKVADLIGWPKLAELFPVQAQRAVTDQVNETGVRQGGAIKRGPKPKTETVANKGSSLADLTLPLRIMKQQMANEHYQQMLAETAKRDAQAKAQAPINKADVPIWDNVTTKLADVKTVKEDRDTIDAVTSRINALKAQIASAAANADSTTIRQNSVLKDRLEQQQRLLKKLNNEVYGSSEQPIGSGMFGELPVQTKPKKQDRRLSIGAAGGMTQNDLWDALLGGQFGDYISALINNGEVVIHPTDETIPGGVSQAGPIQGAVTPDGKIHLAANNLDAASANGVILHEVFHSRGQSLVGSPVWQSLMRQMSNIVSGVGNGTETGDFWVQAVRQAQAANTSPDMMAEEVAAYAVENAENATPGVRAFVARMLGAVKAWALKTFGVQFGKLTPEQLRSLAIAALRAKPMATQSATRYSIGSDDLTDKVNDTKQAAKDQSEAALNKIKRFFTKAATLDQLRQMHAGLFVNQKGEDLLSKLVSVIQRMAPKAQKLREQSDALSQRFINLKKADSEMADRFAQLAIDATMANVRLGKFAVNDHLKNGGRNAQGKGRLNDLQREYQALSADARQLYDDMAAYYRTMQNEMARNIVDNRLRQYGVTPINRKAFIDRVIAGKMTQGDMGLFKDKGQALERLKQVSQLRVIQGDYFPLMRNGKFIVTTNNKIKDLMGGHEIEPGKVEFRAKTEKQARALAEHFASEVDLPQTNWQKSPVSQANDYGFIVSVQTRGAHFFESEAEAIAWRREHAKDFDEISEVSPIRETGLGSSDLTTAQLNSLMATVRNSNYSDDEKEAMMDMLQQGSAVLMSGNRIQKRGIARRKVLGASNDFGRNVVQYGEAVSNRLAQLEFRPEIDDALKEMREIDKNTMDKLHPARTTVLNEITARVDSNVTAANEPPRWLSDLMSLTFLGRLASPMYSVINGMQPWMVTYPVLAGRYGPVRAASMLREAYGSIGFTDQAIAGLKNTYLAGKNFNSVAILNTDDVAKSIRDKLKTQSDGAELNKVMDMLLERGAMSEGGFELAQSIAQGRGAWGSTIAKTDRIARQLPKVVEDVNRAVSAIAAYRLARASGMSDEKARDHAFDVVMNTQGDYSNVNAPRFFSNPYLRPALQFKKYAQMMGYLLADMAHRSFGPNTPKEERAVALKQLGSVMGVQIAMAGALSLPGIEIAKIGFMVASALGFGGGWDDEEEKLRKYADETFGKSWGEMLTRGVVSRALNIDLSQRLSLADMMTFGEPNKYDKDGLQSYLWQMATGAPGGTLEDVRHGVTDAVKGDWAAAAGRLLPVKIIADAFKAANGYSEGKVKDYEVAMNIFGVKSGRQAEDNRKTGNNIRAREKLEVTHKELTDAYLKAKSAGERVKLRAKIIEFNKTAPLRQKVFPNSLDKVRQRIEAERVS